MMSDCYAGKSKTVLKQLGFLVQEYNLRFLFQSFDNYYGFNGPIDTYSFIGKNGCFTLLNVVQLGEWGWYKSKKVSYDLYKLTEMEIKQNEFITSNTLFFRTHLKKLGGVIKKEIEENGNFFGIQVDNMNQSGDGSMIDKS